MLPYFDNGVVQLYQADAREIPLPDQSVHCVVTSPPYFGLRVYKDNDDRGIGLEASVDAYIANLVDVFREVRRVLRDDGVCWVNLGESRTGSRHGPATTEHMNGASDDTPGLENIGDLLDGNRLDIPERVVLALQADGWIWRDTVIWAKKSAMPESVNGWRWERCRVKSGREATDWAKTPKGWDTGEGSHDETPGGNYRQNGEREATVATYTDCPGCPKCAPNDGLVLRKGSWRTTSSHEYIFMLSKGMGYYCDAEAVKTVVTTPWHGVGVIGASKEVYPEKYFGVSKANSGANRRSVWNDISPEPYGGSHYATFPSDLPRICIQASTSEAGVCGECGSQWARVVEHKNMEIAKSGESNGMRTGLYGTQVEPPKTKTLGWRPTCTCDAPAVPATVLDPFAGTATTCLAAQRLGRRAVGVDISEDYLQQAVKRISAVTLPLAL